HIDCTPRLNRLCHASLDQTKANRIHVDVVSAPLLRQSLRESDHASLTRGVTGLTRIPRGSRNGSNIHDLSHHALAARNLAFGGCTKKVGGRAQQSERRYHVNIQHRQKLFVGSLLDDAVPAET